MQQIETPELESEAVDSDEVILFLIIIYLFLLIKE